MAEAQRAVVLGAGRVGRLIASALSEDQRMEVVAVDNVESNLSLLPQGIEKVNAEISSRSIPALVKNADIVIGAVPGFMGYEVLRAVIAQGKDCCDISFMPQNPMDLDALAKKHDCTSVFDCGIAPGLSNMIAGRMDAVRTLGSVEIMVGGLPANPSGLFGYRALFSPIDVLEEYTRPARVVRGGNVITMPALSELEVVEFPGIGRLEAFNTDGLRSLLHTMSIRNMRERTLRYEGHAEKILLLREIGLFGKNPVNIKGVEVRPIDMAAKLLFPLWRMKEGEEDVTVMRVRGSWEGGVEQWDVLDRSTTGISSMARTTGYTAVLVAHAILSGEWEAKGVSPPEFLGREERLFGKIIEGLRGRGIAINVQAS
ncbi:MAG: saccharopine dehydrogenase C-terminal domain-containing protein [Candidatus Thermoplasmatota archaeon]